MAWHDRARPSRDPGPRFPSQSSYLHRQHLDMVVRGWFVPVVAAAILVAAAASILLGPSSAAAWTSRTSNPGNAFGSDSLAPPTGLDARGRCSLLIVGPEVALSWSASASSYAGGYQILRSSAAGGPYTQVGSVNGRATVSYVDTQVSGGRTYHYVIKATHQSWTSADSNEASATTPSLCL
jgi:hypothetical protein